MKCYLCGCEKNNMIHIGVRDDTNTDVYKCEECGLVFLGRQIDDIDKFYEMSGMRASDSESGRDSALKAAEPDDIRRFRRVRPLIENKKVLDFGCGAGGFIRHARTAARLVDGIELEEKMRVEIAQEGISCYATVEECEQLGRNRYNIITLFHVLEHIPDPISTLIKLKSLLEGGGRIIVEVPNADDALLGLYNNEAFSDFTYWSCHLYLFNTATLREIAQRAGLKVNFISQVQRYPLSNHLYWLSKGKPGGHVKWSAMNDETIDKLYGDLLAKFGIADTLFAEFEKEN